jgi:hypothetical protein
MPCPGGWEAFATPIARETDQSHWRPAMETLAGNFTSARWALNTVSDRYLKSQREHYIRFPNWDT